MSSDGASKKSDVDQSRCDSPTDDAGSIESRKSPSHTSIKSTGSSNASSYIRSRRPFEAGDYVAIGEPLGEGSYGCVRRAVHAENEEFVAIKFAMKANEEAHRCLLHELDMAKKHAHIVSFEGTVDGKACTGLIMPLYRGGTLGKVKAQTLTCDPFEDVGVLIKYAAQISSALQHLHSEGVAHLDVKPENIVLHFDGNAYLVDFGVSVAFDHSTLEVTKSAWLDVEALRPSKNPLRCGTLAYRAPEVVREVRCDMTSIDQTQPDESEAGENEADEDVAHDNEADDNEPDENEAEEEDDEVADENEADDYEVGENEADMNEAEEDDDDNEDDKNEENEADVAAEAAGVESKPAECTAAKAPLDPCKLDVFSFGVTLFVLLTGKFPYDEVYQLLRRRNTRPGPSANDCVIAECIASCDDYLFPTEDDPNYCWVPLLRAMLHKDPAQRPEMASVTDQLNRLQELARPAQGSAVKAVAAKRAKKNESPMELKVPGVDGSASAPSRGGAQGPDAGSSSEAEACGPHS